MKFWEALRELENGKKIRREHFDHLQPHGFNGLCELLTDCCDDEIRSYLSSEWESFTNENPGNLKEVTIEALNSIDQCLKQIQRLFQELEKKL